MFNFTRAIVRHSKNNIGKYSYSRVNNYLSTAVPAEHKSSVNEAQLPVMKTMTVKSSNSIVAAAFASLSNENTPTSMVQTPFTDNKIEKATTVDELLSISADGAGISRRHALKVVSVLATWCSTGKVKLSDFESDGRFNRLCRVLTKNGPNSNKRALAMQHKSEDLSMIMNVAADDEAAKLVASITLPQMVKVMQSLASRKRRSTMLLRSLSYNITKSSDILDLKQSADLLYSMCVLNFSDENLLEKISSDTLQTFKSSIKKSSVIGSIITSLGLLKYKDTSGMLDTLCAWMLDNHTTCRSQDLFGLFLTLGVLNYQPANADQLFEKMIPLMSLSDALKPNIWLDYVWALVVLKRANQTHLDSVLNPEFVDLCTSIPSRIKLLHLNAESKGNRLPASSDIFETSVTRTKEKEDMVNSVLDTLQNLMKSQTYIQSKVDLKMGFYVDAECIIDTKCLPVANEKYSAEDGHVKVAFMVQDYHDMCRGRVEPTGTVVLQQRILEQRGYKVLQIPFYDYRVRDKLIHRVQLIQSRLKAVVASPSAFKST